MPLSKPPDGGRAAGGASPAATMLDYGRSGNLFVFIAIPTMCVLIGLSLPILARWALNNFSSMPFKPLVRFAGGIEAVWQVAVNILLWLAFGLGIAFAAKREAVRASVSDESLDLVFQGAMSTFPRGEITAIFPDGPRTVVLGQESLVLFDERWEAPLDQQRKAFLRHQYPWREKDPFEDRYQLWEPGSPGLPDAVEAALETRRVALSLKSGTEVRRLRDVIQRQGYVVRDSGGRQLVRPLFRSDA